MMDYRTYSVSKRSKSQLLQFIIDALTGASCRIMSQVVEDHRRQKQAYDLFLTETPVFPTSSPRENAHTALSKQLLIHFSGEAILGV